MLFAVSCKKKRDFLYKGKSVIESVFREYDIRGKIGTELPLEEVYALGTAIAYYYLIKTGSTCTISIARDGRVHSEYIQQELIRALRDSGINVVDLGLCSTPIVYFSLHVLSVDGGLMVTASHNSKDYNGIKLCLAKDALWGSQIKEIRELFKQKKSYKALQLGTYKCISLIERYTLWLAEQFKGLQGASLPLVIDCAYGATGPLMSELKRLLKWDTVELMYETIDGTFPAHDPDPVVEKNMVSLKERMLVVQAQFGIGFDGDGDRMSAVLPSGELILGDKLGALFAKDILQKYTKGSMIFDVKCSGLVSEVIAQYGGTLFKSPSGHSIIKYHMKKHNAVFAGEYSCHFFFKDKYFGYDDGIYAALRLCELVYSKGKNLDELIAQLPVYVSSPEIRIACATEIREKLLEGAYTFFASKPEAAISTVDGVQATLPYGWGLLRSSNTQPEVCLRFESQTSEGLERIKSDFYHVLKNHMDGETIKTSLEL